MISLILPEVSTAMMQLFLDHVSASYADSFIVMQLDQAAWHQTKELRVEDEYAPDQSACLQSRTGVPRRSCGRSCARSSSRVLACASLDEVVDRLCQGLNQLEAQPDRLRQMTFFPHFRAAS